MHYVPGIHSTPDLCAVTCHDGIKQHLRYVNSTPNHSPYYNAPLFPSLTPHVIVNAEVIKQTILGHEAIFRHQVIELHRLYGKQRELMNELRTDLNRQTHVTSTEYGWIEQNEPSVVWLYPPYVPHSATQVHPLTLEVGKYVHSDSTHEVESTLQQTHITSTEYGWIEQKEPSVVWIYPPYVPHSATQVHPLTLEVGKYVHSDSTHEVESTLQQTHVASTEYGCIEQKEPSVVWLYPPYVPHSATQVHPLTLEAGKYVHSDSTHEVESTLQQCELLDDKCKKYNNKVLDLHLLATEYMDDEDDRFSTIAKSCQQVRNTSSFSALRGEQVGHQHVGLVNQVKYLHPESASAHPILFDLNEPYTVDDTTLEKAYVSPIMSNEGLAFDDLSIKTTSEVACQSSADTEKNVHDHVANMKDLSSPRGFLSSANSPRLKPTSFDEHPGVNRSRKRSSKKRTLNSNKSKWCLPISENSAQDTLITDPKSLQLIAASNKNEAHSKHVFYSEQSMLDFRRNPIAVQALPCTHAAMPMKRRKSKLLSTATGRDGGNSQPSELLHLKPLTNKGLLNPLVDYIKKARKSDKGRRSVRSRNVNRLGIPNQRVPMKCTVDSFPKAPLSPENEECSPPRGESDENLLEDGDAETDIAKSAAKAILLMSAADVHMNRCSLSETSCSSPESPLHWFAKVVSFADNITRLPPSSENQASSSDDLDYFETMTLKLEDANMYEQYWGGTARQDAKLSLVTTSSEQTKRANGRRSKKLNNFQEAVLPSISSLSRHEVTEDLQLIECLIEVAGSPGICGLKRRNTYASGAKQMSDATSPRSLLDLHNESSDHHDSERRLMIDWGKITKRRRGQRYPAKTISFIHIAATKRRRGAKISGKDT